LFSLLVFNGTIITNRLYHGRFKHVVLDWGQTDNNMKNKCNTFFNPVLWQ